ncbi:hypothetical protein [Microbaculum marinum]|uniref:Uncharacterized protein n=1 Tax=Microbaculum marinum TaxID=1764581 RepID=A0AAW9RTE1_9HYPH
MVRFAAVAACAVVASLGAFALSGIGAPAAADNFLFLYDAHRNAPWNGPECDEPSVLSAITARFDQTEAEYWHTGVRMADITEARETAFRDWDPTIIARRYCTGTAYLTDGNRYNLVYWLRSEQGFAGVGWGVQYCLVGRDRDYSYAPACKMLRPL